MYFWPVLSVIIIFLLELIYRLFYGFSRFDIYDSILYICLLVSVVAWGKNRVLSVLALFYSALVYFSQMVGYAVYGYWVPPIYYVLFFEKPLEALQSTGDVLVHALPALTISSVVVATLLFLRKKRVDSGYAYVDIVFLLVFFFLPVKTYLADGGRGEVLNDRYSAIKAGYYSTSYLLGKYIPDAVTGKEYFSEYSGQRLLPGADKKFSNVIFVMGESLSSSNMSVFGYARDTTPWLKNSAESGNGVVVKAYSSGTFTDITLPMFFNLIPTPNGDRQIASRKTNIFGFAREHGYKTAFYSAQQADGLALMNKVGLEFIDDYKNSTDLGYDSFTSALDMELVDYLDDIDWSKNNFVVLHQRGSHARYTQRVPAGFAPFGTEGFLNQYDNTVAYTDEFVAAVVSRVSKMSADDDWVVFFTSDHGQSVTDNNIGFGSLVNPSDYMVPAAVWAGDMSLIEDDMQVFRGCDVIFHYQLATLLAKSLGADIRVAGCDTGYVNGSRMNGSAGFIEMLNTP